MKENEDIQPVPLVYSGEGITLPFSEDGFKDFIVSLLGKPELIEGYVEGAFSLDFGNVQNLNYQIENRISQQNDSNFLQFSAKIYFDDNSCISLNSLENLINYKENRPVVCVGFDFTWVYLVRFGNKNIPERQEIRIFTRSEINSNGSKSSQKVIGRWIIDQITELPKIRYEIRCTANTWGFEIGDLIKNTLFNVIVSPLFLVNFRQSLIKSTSAVLIFVFSVVLSLMLWIQGGTMRNLVKDLDLSITNEAEIPEKISIILSLLKAEALINSLPNVALLLSTTLLITFLIYFFILEIIKFPNYGFILFTEKSIINRKKCLSAEKRKKINAFLGLIFSILIGVLSNYAFELLRRIT